MAQINIRIWKSLNARFTTAVERAFLRRDSYLADVLRHELPAIDEELVGLVNSDSARRLIAKRLEMAQKESVTLKLPDVIVNLLKQVCERHNLVRDALFNRMLFFLTFSPEAVVRFFSMSEEALDAIVGNDVKRKDGGVGSPYYNWIRPAAMRSSTPLQLAQQLVMLPFDAHRAVLDVLGDSAYELEGNDPGYWKDVTLSTLSFCRVAESRGRPEWAGLSLYVPMDETPGTDAYETRRARERGTLERLEREFDML